jgi:hypothetical protein
LFDDVEKDDEFLMFPLLQKRLAEKKGRKPLCPYCGQVLGINQRVVQKKIWLPTRPKHESRLVLTWFHQLCWFELDARTRTDERYLKRKAYGRRRKVSFEELGRSLSGNESILYAQKPRPNFEEIPLPEETHNWKKCPY